jgi:hypothetical protein
MTAKVSVGAHERLKALSTKLDAKMQDVLSACLLHMTEEQLIAILAEQKAKLDELSPTVRRLLKNIDHLSSDEREFLRDSLI